MCKSVQHSQEPGNRQFNDHGDMSTLGIAPKKREKSYPGDLTDPNA